MSVIIVVMILASAVYIYWKFVRRNPRARQGENAPLLRPELHAADQEQDQQQLEANHDQLLQQNNAVNDGAN